MISTKEGGVSMVKLKKIMVNIETALTLTGLKVMNAFADDLDAASILNAAGSNDSVDKIGNTAKSVVNSVYINMRNIGVIIAVIALIVGFIRLGINRNSQKREAGKDTIIWVCIAAFLIGGAVALIGAALNVGASARMQNYTGV